MRRNIAALVAASLSSAAPPVPDASQAQRIAAAGALPAAVSADPVPMDLSGLGLGRIFYGDTLPAQRVTNDLFPTGVQSGIGVGTDSWPALPKRRIDKPVP